MWQIHTFDFLQKYYFLRFTQKKNFEVFMATIGKEEVFQATIRKKIGTFLSFSTVSFHHKWNGTRLFPPGTECTSCLTFFRTA